MKHGRTSSRIAVALGVAMLATIASQGKTVIWDGADGDWDTTTDEWKGTGTVLFAPGDTVEFGAESPNRNRLNEIFIGTAGVPAAAAPVLVKTLGGYGCKFAFSGGDITDYGATPTAISIGKDNPITFRRGGSYSFSGGITGQAILYAAPQMASAGQTISIGTGTIQCGGVDFQPTASGTKLANTIDVYNTAGVDTFNWYASANADWSATTVNLHGGRLYVGQNANNYTALRFTLASNMTVRLDARNTNPFSADIDGPAILTLDAVTGYNGRARITGAGYWDIGGVVKAGAGQLDIEAPEVFGKSLSIPASMGKLKLVSAAQTQTVKQITLGDVTYTAPGTYGHSSASPTFAHDTYFVSAPGVVRILPPTGTVLTVR